MLISKIRLYFFVASLISGVATVCAESTFKLRPVNDAIEGRRFQVVFEFKTDDASLVNSTPMPSPQRPEIEGCTLYSGPGTTISQEYYMTNGHSSATCSILYTYLYRADKSGKATIPALTLKVGGKTYQSKPQTFTIVEGNSNNLQSVNPSHPYQGGQGGGNAASGNISVGQVTAKDLMVNISFSKSKVYEQEPVVASIKLYLRHDRNFTIDGSTFKALKLPVFDGFLSEDLPVSQSNKLENINGQVYNVWELKRVLLFPQKSGRLSVHSGQYEITVIEYEWLTHGFMRTRREVPRTMSTATNTAAIQVDALPEPKPSNFSGAVGNYSISSKLSTDVLRTNEAATYSLTIKGSGNIKYLAIPEVEFPSTFDKYTAKSDIQANFNGSTYVGSYKIDYPFLPQEIGKFSIPPQQFVYFDLSTKKYVTIEAEGFELNVARGTSANTIVSQKTIDAKMNDILHIHPLQSKVDTVKSPVIRTTSYWLAYLVAMVILITSIIVYRRHIKNSADVVGRRLARANKVASKRFKVAYSFMKAHKSDKFYEELARALKGYISDKLGIAPSQLISDTIIERLSNYGASDDAVNQVIEVLNECEMARFTPSQSDDAMNDIYNRASSAIKAIEDIKTK